MIEAVGLRLIGFVLVAGTFALVLALPGDSVSANHGATPSAEEQWTFDSDLEGWSDISGTSNYIQWTAGELELVDVVGTSSDAGRAMAEVSFAPIEATYFAYDYRSTNIARALFAWQKFDDGTRSGALHNHGYLFDEDPNCRLAASSNTTYRIENFFDWGTGIQQVYVNGAYLCDSPYGLLFPQKATGAIQFMTDNTQTNFSVFIDNVVVRGAEDVWSDARPLAIPLFASRAAVAGEYLYTAGGISLDPSECANWCSHIWRSPVAGIEAGSTADWSIQRDMFPPGGELFPVSVGDWLFVLAHESSAGDVLLYRFDIEPTSGMVSNRQTVGLPGGSANSPRIVAAGGRLYIVDRPSADGETPLPTTIGDVNPTTGDVSWTTTSSPSGNRAGFEIATDGSHIYFAGGNTGGTGAIAQTNVQFTSIDPTDGSL